MITLKLQIENPAILTPLKEVLMALKGVKIIDSANDNKDIDKDEIPNDITLAAMKEATSGKDAGSVSLKDLDSFITSLS